jgi:hypothetical protein
MNIYIIKVYLFTFICFFLFRKIPYRNIRSMNHMIQICGNGRKNSKDFKLKRASEEILDFEPLFEKIYFSQFRDLDGKDLDTREVKGFTYYK